MFTRGIAIRPALYIVLICSFFFPWHQMVTDCREAVQKSLERRGIKMRATVWRDEVYRCWMGKNKDQDKQIEDGGCHSDGYTVLVCRLPSMASTNTASQPKCRAKVNTESQRHHLLLAIKDGFFFSATPHRKHWMDQWQIEHPIQMAGVTWRKFSFLLLFYKWSHRMRCDICDCARENYATRLDECK